MSIALNVEQQNAVTHSGSPLLIVAGPGSGKTRVIIERILHFIKNGLKPSEILCLTFSEKAAEEMKQRLEKSIDISDMQISTFHSFAKDMLEDNVLVSGIGMSAGVISRASQLVWALKNIDTFGLQYIQIGHNAAEVIESIIDGISTFKDELVTHEELKGYLEKKLGQEVNEEQRNFLLKLEDMTKIYEKYQNFQRRYLEKKLGQEVNEEQRNFLLKLEDMTKIYEKYQNFQRSRGIIDFDDMIVEAVKLLKRRNDIVKKYQNRYKQIFVDEFQDNNFAQLELVKLISKNGNVTAVGDDDQCIYRFQGAYLTNFKDFAAYFKNTKIITLNENYRSPRNIVNLASQLLEKVPERQPKKLFTENEDGEQITLGVCSNENSETEFVAETISSLIGKSIKRRDGSNGVLTYKDFAILSRKKKLGQKFANALKAHGIPIIFSGESNLFAMPVVRDFLSFLRIADDPGRSGMDITRLMTLSGISEQNIAEINRIAKKMAYSDPTDIDFVFETLKNSKDLNVTQKHILRELRNQLDKLIVIRNSLPLSELVYKTLMSISGLYKQALISNTPENRRIRLILRELYTIASEFESLNPHSSLGEFISHLALMENFDIEIEDEHEFDNAVQISTIHQSKGKEYPIVFIVDLAVNKIPLRYQSKKFYVPNELSRGLKIAEDEKELYLQEERRLLYVAMTRAQNMLFMSYAQQYEDNKRESAPSRFLDEINFNKNSLIRIENIKTDNTETESFIVEENKIERLKRELQLKVMRSVSEMNLQTAIHGIIDLAKLNFFEEKKSIEGFDPFECRNVDYDSSNLDCELNGIHIPLINKEELKLSASKLETYSDCPLKFKFAHILEIPTPSKSFFDLGTSVHAVAERLTQLEIDGIKITQEMAMEILEKEWISSSFKSETEANQAKEKAKEMLKTYLNWHTKNPNSAVAAEQKFTIEIAGIPFNGSIDRIEKTPSGDYDVIDFKTGGVYETKKSIKDNIQMNIYALATEKLYEKQPRTTSLFYLKKDKTITNKIEPAYVLNIKKMLEEKVNLILEEEFNATPSYDICRKCDYQVICDNKKIR